MPSALEQLQVLMQLARLGQSNRDQVLQERAAARADEDQDFQRRQREAYAQLGAPTTAGLSDVGAVVERVGRANVARQFPMPTNATVFPDAAVAGEVQSQFGDSYDLKKQLVSAGVMSVADFSPEEAILYNREKRNRDQLEGRMQAEETDTERNVRESGEWAIRQGRETQRDLDELSQIPVPAGMSAIDVMMEKFPQTKWSTMAKGMGAEWQAVLKQKLLWKEKARQVQGAGTLTAPEQSALGMWKEIRDDARMEIYGSDPVKAPHLYRQVPHEKKRQMVDDFKAQLDAKYANAPRDGWFGLGKSQEYNIELQMFEGQFKRVEKSPTDQMGQAMAGQKPQMWWYPHEESMKSSMRELIDAELEYRRWVNIAQERGRRIMSTMPGDGDIGGALVPSGGISEDMSAEQGELLYRQSLEKQPNLSQEMIDDMVEAFRNANR